MKQPIYIIILILILIIILISSCNHFSGEEKKAGRLPGIKPDYTDVTIPPNIAPLNFIIEEEGKRYLTTITAANGDKIEVSSSNGHIIFPFKDWKKLLKENTGKNLNIEIRMSDENGSVTTFEPFTMHISKDKVDPWLAYRLIPPGYYSWSRIRIMQRCLEDFTEETLVENTILDKNCINCHSFANNDPERFQVHIRGNRGGTYFMKDGEIKKTDPRVESMPGSATYPSWHPGGRFIAYSSNQVRQSFYAEAPKSIEVFDIAGSMVVFDTEKNEILTLSEEDTTSYLRTFPGWSHDGKYLYYCRAVNNIPPDNPEMEKIMSIRHDLVRKSFDESTGTFGETEVVFAASAINKSVSFPRISPDGKQLVFTMHDFGTFPIWHSEADLYSINLETNEIEKLGMNSDHAESYHSWSLNSRWLVFSSKRSDGRSTRPYIAYIDENGKSAKPFMLPQKDPSYYDRLIESYNIPEFITGKVDAGPRDFEKATRHEAVKATPGNNVADEKNNVSDTNNISTATTAHQ